VASSVVLQGNYGWRNTNYPVAAINYDTTSWTVAAGAQWKIFDGFGIQAKIKEAYANLNQALASKELIRKSIELDVKTVIS